MWVARVRGACMSWGHVQRTRAGTNAHPRGTHTETGAHKGEELEGSGKGKGVGGKKKVCSVDDCFNKVNAKGLCSTHRLRKPCSLDGCPTKAHAHGLCRKHGAFGKCVNPDCTSNAVKVGSHCWKHGPKLARRAPQKKQVCSVDDCSNKVAARGLCDHHRRKPCSVEGCDTKSQARGLCSKHGANGICTADGCTSNVQRRGLCIKHGSHGRCTAAGCTEKARNRKLCRKHDTHPNTKCMWAWDNCKTPAVANGFCQKHGAYGVCLFGECRTSADRNCHGYCMKHKHHHA